MAKRTKAAGGWMVALACGVCAADRSARADGGGGLPPERPGMAYRAWAPIEPVGPARSEAAPGRVQVNVRGDGQNIPGDAANEPSIAIDPTAPNRMVIGWRQFDSVLSDFRQAGYAFSLDGGRTWSPRGTLDRGVFRSDPVLDCDATGRVYFSSLRVNSAIGIYQPTLSSAEKPGRPFDGRQEVPGGDKVWMVADRLPGSAPGGLYQSWNTAGNSYPGIFSRSLDGGFTWTRPVDVPGQPVFGTVALGPGGEVYVVGVPNVGSTTVWSVARSVDARLPGTAAPTFALRRTLPAAGTFSVGGAPNPSGLLGQVWVAVDTSTGPRRGWVYVVGCADPTGVDPQNIVFTRSTDRGATWSTPVKVNADVDAANAWQWFPAMSVAPDGRIDVAWLDSRESAARSTLGNLVRLYYRSSSDGGLTWGAEQVLSPEFDSRVGWPQQQKIGDYYHLRSDRLGASLAWAATFNGEQDIYFTRIGPEDCNGNGIDDAQELIDGAAADCNGNGLPDACDIASGLEPDRDGDGVPDSCQGRFCRATDYNRDGFNNLDDLADYITDFYTQPAIPGGVRDEAPTLAGVDAGSSVPCASAPDAPGPYEPAAYRLFGYRVAAGSGNPCPSAPDQPFPNLDLLADFVTAFYGPCPGV